jgi:hypothetical protein
MLSKELKKMLNRCIVDSDFCWLVLNQPLDAFKECDLSPEEQQIVVAVRATTLANLAAGLNKASADQNSKV